MECNNIETNDPPEVLPRVVDVFHDPTDATGRTVSVVFNKRLNDKELADFHDFLMS